MKSGRGCRNLYARFNSEQNLLAYLFSRKSRVRYSAATMPKRSWQKFGLILGGWTLLVVTSALHSYLYLSTRGETVTWRSVFAWACSEWYTWAALSPLILWLARRFRLERTHWQRVLLIHLTASLFCVGFQPVLQATVKYLGWGGDLRPRPFLVILTQLFFAKLPINFAVYWIVIGLSHGAEYYRRYRERERQAAQLETLLAQARLQALKMQLHPHFLFNALNSLADLIDHEPQAAQKMVARLGDFLRLTLHSSATQQIALAEEIEFLRNYLEIERIRFADRLQVLMDIAPETLTARVPTLLLQPLVENAIRHGIAQQETPGCVAIKTWREADQLHLQVSDNGPGLSAQTAQETNGLGLRNTRARLQTLYGDAQRLELAEVLAGGVIVTLEIPFTTTGEENRDAA
jgi:two-component system, LytTR family, sensor kinase